MGLLGAGAVASGGEAPQRRALLIGVTKYPSYAPDRWLEGPVNDVALLADVLTREPFGLRREDIATLAGWPDDVRLRPTRENIEREFRRLASVSRPGDQVVVLIASHGSQQPADDDPNDPEPDELDEIFLPADAKGWSGPGKRVENAIVDDELRAWVLAIRNAGAFVWVIVDTCHAGTMIRGAPADVETERRIPVEDLVPRDVLAGAARRASARSTARGGLAGAARPPGLLAGAGEVVATYAAQTYETAPELRLPPGGSRKYGLFTYTLAQVLLDSSTPLTYRELIEQVSARYRAMARTQPQPALEGGGMDREVLGMRSGGRRPVLLLGQRVGAGEVELRAGSLHGLRPGTVLAIFPPAGAPAADQSVGHVVVRKVEPLTAVVAPVEYERRPAPAVDRLVAGSRAEPVFIDYGDLRLRVAVQTGGTASVSGAGPSGPPVETHAPGRGPAALETALAALDPRVGRLVERVTDAGAADWFVRVAGDEVLLIPASGWGSGATATPAAAVPTRFTAGRLSAGDLATRLTRSLERIARARSLLRLAADPGPSAEGPARIDVRVELLRVLPGGGREAVPFDAGGRVLYVGDQVAFRITNPSSVTLDVSLLFVDSALGIMSLVPDRHRALDSRLGPGQSIVTDTFDVSGDSLGHEQVVAIAVRAGAERTDFAVLEQSGLDAVRAEAAERSLGTPLGRLIDSAAYGRGSVRGLKPSDVAAYAARLLDWVTRRGPRPS